MTGPYGNVDRMPERHWYYGYPAAIGLMAVE
jgi:Mg2+ and Co2+ transporter CorA